MANTDLVLKMYDYFGKGDMASIKRELFHPSITWTMPGHHPLSAKMEGADAVIAFFGALFKAGIRWTTSTSASWTTARSWRSTRDTARSAMRNSFSPPAPAMESRMARSRRCRSIPAISIPWTGTCGRSSSSRTFPTAWAINERSRSSWHETQANITPEHVEKAYGALGSGDIEQIKQYWAEDMVWQVPGHNRLSGWYHGLDEFLAFMAEVGRLSDHSFHMDLIAGEVLVTGDYSADLTRNRGHAAGQPDKTMDIAVVHVLHWRDGKVVAGKGAIFGDGTTEYDQFWSHSPKVTPATHSLGQPAAGQDEAAKAARAERQWSG